MARKKDFEYGDTILVEDPAVLEQINDFTDTVAGAKRMVAQIAIMQGKADRLLWKTLRKAHPEVEEYACTFEHQDNRIVILNKRSK